MTCPHCGRQTDCLVLGATGQRCHGCRDPKLDRAGNLRARIEQMKVFAAKQSKPMQCVLAAEIGELESEVGALNS